MTKEDVVYPLGILAVASLVFMPIGVPLFGDGYFAVWAGLDILFLLSLAVTYP